MKLFIAGAVVGVITTAGTMMWLLQPGIRLQLKEGTKLVVHPYMEDDDGIQPAEDLKMIYARKLQDA